jgi:hypothetical protein
MFNLETALFVSRDVAQPGRAPRSGRGSRWFKSSRPDHSIILFFVMIKGN